MPYKVAISGLYKQTKFALVLPYENKPQMLDDTCYFIGFDNYISALISMQLLNHDITQKFLKSIVFFDSKRAIVKEILMRISIKAIIRYFNSEIPEILEADISSDDWENYLLLINGESGTLTPANLFS